MDWTQARALLVMAGLALDRDLVDGLVAMASGAADELNRQADDH